MRFLFFTDTHIRGTTPESRVDDYYETLKTKFSEVVDLSSTYEVDYILHGGDWFDRPDVSPAIVREFAKLLGKFKAPILTIAGNHDIFGQNPDTINRTMLGILEGTGLIRIINPTEKIILEKDAIRVQITGESYNYAIDGEDRLSMYMRSKDESCHFAIHMVHGMLLKKPFFDGIKYTVIEELSETQVDVTLTGHYHAGFGIVKLNNKYFVNPGSLMRITCSKSDMERTPKVVIIDVADTLKIQEVSLLTAKPGHEVFDRQCLEQSEKRNFKLHDFYKGLNDEGMNQSFTINEIFDLVESMKDVSYEVKKEVLDRLTDASERLTDWDG